MVVRTAEAKGHRVTEDGSKFVAGAALISAIVFLFCRRIVDDQSTINQRISALLCRIYADILSGSLLSPLVSGWRVGVGVAIQIDVTFDVARLVDGVLRLGGQIGSSGHRLRIRILQAVIWNAVILRSWKRFNPRA